jgi:MFS family permease
MALLPDAGPARTLAVATLVNTVGNGAFITASVLYFTRVVGLSAPTVGIGLTIAGLAGLFSGVPAGHLADRIGARTVAAAMTACAGVITLAYLVVRGPVGFVVVAVLWALSDRAAYAGRQALIAESLRGNPKLARTRAYLRSVTNVGMAVGAALAGVAVQLDTRPAYLAVLALDALTFLGCALIFLRLPASGARTEPEPLPGKGRPSAFAVLRDRPYTVLTALNMVLLLHVPLLEVVLPLWVVRYTSAPRVLVSVLILVNTLTVVLCQVRVARGVETLDPAVRALRLSGLLLFAACLAFALSAHHGAALSAVVLVVAAGLHVAGEMTQAAGAWVVSYDLAPEDAMGQYLGLFNTGTAAAQQFAPALLVFLIIEWGRPGWFVLGAVFLAAAAATGPTVAWARRVRARENETEGVTGTDGSLAAPG